MASCNGWLLHDSCLHWIGVVCLWVLLLLLVLLWIWIYWFCCCRSKKGSRRRFAGYDSYAQTEDYGGSSESHTVYQNVMVDRDRDGDVDQAIQTEGSGSCEQCDAMMHRRRHMYSSETQTDHIKQEERPQTAVRAAPVFVSKRQRTRTPSPKSIFDSEPESEPDSGGPGPPVNCQLVDYGRNHVDMSWEPPESGGPFHYYVIEKKERTSHWVDHTEVDKNGPTHLKIPKLRAGDKYAFRVRAVNRELGRGKQSEPSNIIGPVVCRPKIDKEPPRRRSPSPPPKSPPRRRRSSNPPPRRRPPPAKRSQTPPPRSPSPPPAAPVRRNSDPPSLNKPKKKGRKKKVAPPPGWRPHQQLPGQPKVVGM